MHSHENVRIKAVLAANPPMAKRSFHHLHMNDFCQSCNGERRIHAILQNPNVTGMSGESLRLPHNKSPFRFRKPQASAFS
ncbi:hypothetical protein [Desulfovibrio desulfuricans]|uniref:hypothetical protein n=1 Tax=Desulfovibrio desulfuricans TaxID=876 RepID=UPI00398427E9